MKFGSETKYIDVFLLVTLIFLCFKIANAEVMCPLLAVYFCLLLNIEVSV